MDKHTGDGNGSVVVSQKAPHALDPTTATCVHRRGHASHILVIMYDRICYHASSALRDGILGDVYFCAFR